MMISTTTGRRMLAANRTANAYAATPGMHTMATLSALVPGAEDMFLALGPAGNNATTMIRKRGAELVLFGTGADNATASCRVYAVKRFIGERNGQAVDSGEFMLTLLATISATLSTAVGVGSVVTSGERFADTLAITEAALVTAIADGYVGPKPVAYSPADNTPGRVIIGDVGNSDLFIEPIIGTATGVNLLIEGNT